jgi:hypothetical protein
MMPPWRRLTCHVLPILCALCVSYVAVQLFGNRYDPRVVLSHVIVPANVMPGQTAAQEIRAFDDRNCQGVNWRWIVDSGSIYYDMASIPVFKHGGGVSGAPFTFMHEFQVPVGITPGKATIYTLTSRWCNVFQEFLWPFTTEYGEDFTVVKKVPVGNAAEPQGN